MVCFLLHCATLLLIVTITSSMNIKQLHRLMDSVEQIFPKAKWTDSRAVASSEPIFHWDVKWYPTMPIDHFSYRNSDQFKLKYLVNYTYFQCGGPLFFYAGNEGSIEGFARNTGIMWDLAPQFQAAIVFAEHRFYGETMPFGNESYTNVTRLGYLTAIQALADFAQLISFLKTDQNELADCKEVPVIAFGGSYGGMLAAWLRMKYPHIVDGAWASSAPIRYFNGTGVDPDYMSNITTSIYVNSGCNRKAFSEGFTAIRRLSEEEKGREALNEIFHVDPEHLLSKQNDFESLYDYIYSAIFYMAMTDYPYPAGFLKPLPAFPVKYVCQFAKDAPSNDKELAEQLYNIINVYYNHTGQKKYNCFMKGCLSNASGTLEGEYGWAWQSCTTMTFQLCDSGGDIDFFIKTCKDDLVELQKNQCRNWFRDIGYSDSLYQLHVPVIRYGITYSAASNIIFSNGNLDPWSGGGVYDDSPGIAQAKKNGVYIFYMKDAAHHLDLRTPNTCDPPSVKFARFQIVNIMKCWISKSCTTPPKFYPLSDNSNWNSSSTCRYISKGYPWGYEEPKRSSHLQISFLLTALATIFKTLSGWLIP